jgi:hypothetical protein
MTVRGGGGGVRGRGNKYVLHLLSVADLLEFGLKGYLVQTTVYDTIGEN